MPLVLIPALLIAGAVFLFLGVHGLPALRPAELSLSYAMQEPVLAPPRTVRSSGRPAAAAPSITQADVLLADVLTEMLELREQFADLGERVAALTTELNQLSADRSPRARRSSSDA